MNSHKKDINRKCGYPLFRNVKVFAILFAAAALAVSRYFTLFRVKGNSMEPALYDDDILLSRRVGKVARGDIVTLRYGGRIIIKRVVGVAGEVVDISSQQIDMQGRGVSDVKSTCKVPEDSLFLIGDNRDESTDSRVFGCVPAERVIGKAIFRLAPLKRTGRIK